MGKMKSKEEILHNILMCVKTKEYTLDYAYNRILKLFNLFKEERRD